MKDLKVLRHKMTSEGRVCLGLANVKRYINNQSNTSKQSMQVSPPNIIMILCVASVLVCTRFLTVNVHLRSF